ncbi:hypothetical protein PIB30_072123 [Stylosanthes scabra]|uniref:CCHC-type domain-containing protein n=1 Tax=Stylosanthes scabra TaxID=79078 RepID=A0ABU6VP76_9FABA|nr:hypothetical protein [Stylosanthes scabra]
MESIHATFKHSTNPVPSEEYWSNVDYLRTEAPVIRRPIGRPKVHNRRRDAVENLMEGNKLKRTFRVTCAKCGEQGHNYKTCKGAPANPSWKPRTSKTRKGRGASSSNTNQVEVPLSQSAPAPEGQQGHSQDAPTTLVISAPVPLAPLPSKRAFRPKQAVRRHSVRSSPPPSEPPTASQVNSNPSMVGPSAETIVAAGAGTQRVLRFMETPTFQKKKN